MEFDLYEKAVSKDKICLLLLNKNGPTGAVIRASPSYNVVRQLWSWNGRTGGQTDRQNRVLNEFLSPLIFVYTFPQKSAIPDYCVHPPREVNNHSQKCKKAQLNNSNNTGTHFYSSSSRLLVRIQYNWLLKYLTVWDMINNITLTKASSSINRHTNKLKTSWDWRFKPFSCL